MYLIHMSKMKMLFLLNSWLTAGFARIAKYTELKIPSSVFYVSFEQSCSFELLMISIQLGER